jgi:hypothetical protein
MKVDSISKLHPPVLNGSYIEFSPCNRNHAVSTVTFQMNIIIIWGRCPSLYRCLQYNFIVINSKLFSILTMLLFSDFLHHRCIRRVWRYKRDNQKPYNTAAKTKRTNNDLKNTTWKIKDQVTRIPLKSGGELMAW